MHSALSWDPPAPHTALDTPGLWVEVLPFHQLGAFKWKELGLEYQLVDTPPASPELVARVIGQFRDAGCNAR
jgi:pyruvate formate lyase activating enzyme